MSSQAAKPFLDDLTDFQIQQICTIYESGVGQGQKNSPGRNPCREGTAEYRAWDMGVLHGQEMQARTEKENAVKPAQDLDMAILTHDAALSLIGLSYAVSSEITTHIKRGVTANGEPAGDWKITVERLDVLGEEPEQLEEKQLEMFDVLPATSAGPGHGDS